jgi:hypothetical protein
LPKGLQSLSFDGTFNQRLDGVTLPQNLHNLPIGYSFHRSLVDVELPKGLQSLSFGGTFIKRLDGVTLPRSLPLQPKPS